MNLASSIRRVTFSASFALALVVAAAFEARAQPLLADGLDCGPVGTPAALRLPSFPSITQDSLQVCWESGAVATTHSQIVKWGTPRPARTTTIPPVCSVFVSRVDITVAGSAQWTGPIRLFYSRTWYETDGAGRRYQVWRFLANGDLRLLGPAFPGCPFPPCGPTSGDRIHHRGFVDYALDLATDEFSVAWALDHDCDMRHHAPGFPRSVVTHPGYSYTHVGPAAGFVPGISGSLESGSFTGDAVRRLDLSRLPASGDVCLNEGDVQSGYTLWRNFWHPRPGPVLEPQYANSDFVATGGCAVLSGITSVLPPGRFDSKAIGKWTASTAYPFGKELRLVTTELRYADPCVPRGTDEVFFGVTTIFGLPAYRIDCFGFAGARYGKIFIDLGNSLGFPSRTRTVNVPYVSDIILNLNQDGTP